MNRILVWRTAFLILPLMLIFSGGGTAALQRGSHVRVTAPQYQRPQIAGVLHQIKPNHLVIKPSLEDLSLVVPRDMITSLQVRSRSRRTGTGAIVGAIGFG